MRHDALSLLVEGRQATHHNYRDLMTPALALPFLSYTIIIRAVAKSDKQFRTPSVSALHVRSLTTWLTLRNLDTATR